MGLLGAFLTSVYTFRMVFLAFFGETRARPSHRPGPAMVLPLVALALLSVAAGYIEIPQTLGGWPAFSDYLRAVFPGAAPAAGSVGWEAARQLLTAALSLGGIYVAYVLYLRRREAVILAALAAAVAWLGGYPRPVLSASRPAVQGRLAGEPMPAPAAPPVRLARRVWPPVMGKPFFFCNRPRPSCPRRASGQALVLDSSPRKPEESRTKDEDEGRGRSLLDSSPRKPEESRTKDEDEGRGRCENRRVTIAGGHTLARPPAPPLPVVPPGATRWHARLTPANPLAMLPLLVLGGAIVAILLAIVLVINSAIGLYCYLRLVLLLYAAPGHPGHRSPASGRATGREGEAAAPLPWAGTLVLAALGVLVVWLGVRPDSMLRILQSMTASFF